MLMAATAAASLVLTATPAAAATPEGWDCADGNVCLYADSGYREKRLETDTPGCYELGGYGVRNIRSYFNNSGDLVADLRRGGRFIARLQPGQKSDDSDYTDVDYACVDTVD